MIFPTHSLRVAYAKSLPIPETERYNLVIPTERKETTLSIHALKITQEDFQNFSSYRDFLTKTIKPFAYISVDSGTPMTQDSIKNTVIRQSNIIAARTRRGMANHIEVSSNSIFNAQLVKETHSIIINNDLDNNEIFVYYKGEGKILLDAGFYLQRNKNGSINAIVIRQLETFLGTASDYGVLITM